MSPLDWVFIGYTLYVPLLIGVYSLEIFAIIKHREKFNTSFHRIFVVLSLVNSIACLVVTFMFRLPLYPMVNRFYASFGAASAWLTAARVAAYYLMCLSDFLSLLLAFNRFTALYFTAHSKFWTYFLPIGVVLCLGTAVAPVCHLVESTLYFRQFPDPRFVWYYPVVASAITQMSIWFNMLVVTLVCNILSFLLYGACLVKYCLVSVARNYTIERNFFLVGVLSMLFSLPFAATMLFLGINLSPGAAGVGADTLISVSFQVPWLTDLKFLSPAPILLITNTSIRRAIVRIFYSKESSTVASHSHTPPRANLPQSRSS